MLNDLNKKNEQLLIESNKLKGEITKKENEINELRTNLKKEENEKEQLKIKNNDLNLKQDKAQETELMLDQKIKEQELRLNNIETRTNALQEEAKAKLKAGDKSGAKRILAKKKKIIRYN